MEKDLISKCFLMTFALTFTGCKKDDESKDSRDIYIAGFDNGYIAYWKNGDETKLAPIQKVPLAVPMELPYRGRMYM